MQKVACNWRVAQTQTNQLRKLDEIAGGLENVLIEKAAELLNGSVANAHWHLLATSADWVQKQCAAAPRELENEALMNVLARIHTWVLDMPRLSERSFLRERCYAQHRKAVNAELGTLRPRSQEKRGELVAVDLSSYAFTQHALRELPLLVIARGANDAL